MPVAGLFNPEVSPDHNFLPVADDRYEFRQFSPMRRDREETDLFQFLDALAAASAGYPVIDGSTYRSHDRRLDGAHGCSARDSIPQTTEEWSIYAESVILHQCAQSLTAGAAP